MPVSAAAQNKENGSTPYTQLGTVTVEGSGNSQGSFTLSVSPLDQAAPAGGSVNYIVTMSDQNGFNEPVTFQASAKASDVNGGDPSQLSLTFNPATLTTSGNTTMTVTATSSAAPASYSVTVTGEAQAYTLSAPAGVTVQNAPPPLTLSPTSGAGSSATFTITWPDNVNRPSAINILIAPSLDGSHACWIYLGGSDLYLASDDGLSWTDAYHLQDPAFGEPTTGPGASNSQCAFAATPNWNTQIVSVRVRAITR